MESSQPSQRDFLGEILSTLQSVRDDYQRLSAIVQSIQGRLGAGNEPQGPLKSLPGSHQHVSSVNRLIGKQEEDSVTPPPTILPSASPSIPSLDGKRDASTNEKPASPPRGAASGFSSRIILTTYPGQSGIDPIVMNWGHPDPAERGPVVVSRSQGTIRRRNAIGAHGGSYSVYHALAVASKNLDLDHKPDFTNAEPAVTIGPFPQWSDVKKIVSLDPFGHLSPWLFESIIRAENIHVRPTIAVTRAHMKLPELEQSVRAGRLAPDGKICLNATGELAVTKFAVEPVWYLPGVAERFGIDEGTLRRSLFENTGGSFPELITRGDMKLFLPPIGGLTVYCFGDPRKMSNANVKLALRIHDECNGSDVFGSDICTCRPYLIFGVEQAVKEAQRGGSGVVVYFRKEGRALGEVTKYLVYNARKRGTDRASEYFQRTETIAGVKDMRFQALMPDILHWLGIKKIDRMLSMSKDTRWLLQGYEHDGASRAHLNKRLSKGKKGLKKRTQDPFTRKDWYSVKAPSSFQIRDVGKTLVNRTTGLKNANDALKGRIFEVSLADLQKDEDHAFRKIQLRVDEVQGKNCLTNFHGLDFTSDKLRSLVRKWQTLIEANITVKTTDDYLLRLFAIAFTKRRPNQIKKTTYARSSQIRAIRKKMVEIIQREASSCSLPQLTTKLIPEVIGREIEKSTQGIYPLQNVHIRKVKLLKAPKFDLGALLNLHGESTTDDQGQKVEREFKEPVPQESV
ncbi:MAG: hypothetical protein LQ343_006042 [Gyalolechia ehrenbergii]|nr:MAG: hypothetical protein LQ343_006042 [Gyalolechia ehrenbergii]